MGRADYFLNGSWNFYCQECSVKWKANRGNKRWDGPWVCPLCMEIRNPQDFVRGIPDNPRVPWATGNVPPKFVPSGGGVTPSSAGALMFGGWMLGSKPL